jgi:hypothetical protein
MDGNVYNERTAIIPPPSPAVISSVAAAVANNK